MIILIGTIVSVDELTFDSLFPFKNSGHMKFTSHLLVAASVVLLAACSDSKKVENAAVGTTPVNFSTQSASQQSATTATTGVNPEHGQPGHRCDIPVGASLSTPVQPNGSTPQALPQPTALPQPISNTVAPGTNPPHGQPGHDCSIAVGAPLNK